MAEITKGTLKAVKTVQGLLKVKDMDALVLGFSIGSEGRVSKMKEHEARQLLNHMNSMLPKGQQQRAPKPGEAQRRKMIAMAYERAGITASDSQERKRGVVQWLDGWCRQYGYLHKGLNDYTAAELPKLVTQFGEVIKSLIVSL